MDSTPAIKYDGKIAGLYDLEKTLGSGHFAVVKSARHVFTGEKVAVKVIDKTKLDSVSKEHLFQEVRCMKMVQHPNVIKLYEVIDTQTKLYLVLELADGGDLYDYIMRHDKGLSEDIARGYFRQIVRAISYCHKLHVVHRDLKPENVVFFEKDKVVKITDFGFSNKFNPGQKLQTSCGSLAYSAPEILLGDSYDAPAVDVWSLGVILYMLVCGRPPFQEANDSETLTMIMDCKYTLPTHISQDCKELISKMLVREPDKRAKLEQVAMSQWLNPNPYVEDDIIPLVCRQHVQDDDHKEILHQMVSGQIAAKEAVISALENNEYNYITATYYLLAEQKMRSSKLKLKDLSLHSDLKISSNDRKPYHLGFKNFLKPTCSKEEDRDTGTQAHRARKCSVVQEEDGFELPGEKLNNDSLSNRRGSRSEGRLNAILKTAELSEENVSPKNLSKKHSEKTLKSSHTTKSAVCRKCENSKINTAKPICRNEFQTNADASQKYSSSDTSDDDTNEKRKVQNIPQCCKFMKFRRDSQDDSSDSQDTERKINIYSNATVSKIKDSRKENQNDPKRNNCPIYDQIKLKHSLSLSKISETVESTNLNGIVYIHTWDEEKLHIVNVNKNNEIINPL